MGERVDRKEKFQDMLSLQALGNSLSTRVLSTKSNNEVKFSRKVQNYPPGKEVPLLDWATCGDAVL